MNYILFIVYFGYFMYTQNDYKHKNKLEMGLIIS